MAKGTVNRVILVGNLGRDPEVRYTPNGLAVTNLSIATTDGWKDKQTGENQERTEWHRVVMYARQAEVAGEYLKKGAKIYIEGRLQTRKWMDKNTNAERYTTEIIADNMQMLDNKGGNQGGGFGMDAPMDSETTTTVKPVVNTPKAAAPQPQAETAGGFDDDIPF